MLVGRQSGCAHANIRYNLTSISTSRNPGDGVMQSKKTGVVTKSRRQHRRLHGSAKKTLVVEEPPIIHHQHQNQIPVVTCTARQNWTKNNRKIIWKSRQNCFEDMTAKCSTKLKEVGHFADCWSSGKFSFFLHNSWGRDSLFSSAGMLSRARSYLCWRAVLVENFWCI